MKLPITSAVFAVFSLAGTLAFANPLPENILSDPEFVSRGESIAGWKVGGFVGGNPETGRNYDNSAKPITEEGKSFARIICDPKFANFALSPVDRLPLLPEWTALNVSAMVRIDGFTKTDSWGGFNLSLTFYDFDGKPVGDSGETTLRISENQAWKSELKTIKIPEGATEVELALQWLAAGGVADVMNVVLKPQ